MPARNIFPLLSMANWAMFSLFILVKKSLTSLNFFLEGGEGVSQELGVALRLFLVSRTNINWAKVLNVNCLVREVA